MPIYDQSYRSYEGTLRRRGRWAVMVGQELRILFSRRMFIFLVVLGNIHLFLRVLQIYVLDVLSQRADSPLASNFSGLAFDQTGAWVYFDFLRMQSPLVFLTLIYAGSGLICNDFRNNLTEIYFSKPINWRDYAAGKIMSLIAIGMGLSALPALLMGLLHIVFSPTWPAIKETATLAPAVIAFALILVGSMALVILACSCLVNSAKFTGASVFLLTLTNIAFGAMLAGMLQERNYLVLAYPVSLNNVGEFLFQEHRYRNPINVWWGWSAGYIAAVCAMALTVICVKARRAETGR
jgi:ABC-type transport system involved in multi-copper enzyme maturation permease subunit